MCGELIVLFFPEKLSVLHLASFHKSIITKEKKELLKLSKKMLKIIARFSETDLQIYQQAENQNNISLFFDVYNKRNDLTLKELKVLRDYYYLVKSDHRFVINQFYGETSNDHSLIQYSDELDELIDKKRLRKSLNNQFK